MTSDGQKKIKNAVAKAQDATKVYQLPPCQVFTPKTAIDLMAAEFPEPKWALPGFLVEGLNILAGKPKIGKSWLCLGVAVAVAQGGKALDAIEVERGPVLYLALEDTERRLQQRLAAMLDGGAPPAEFHYECHCDRLDEGGLDAIRGWLRANLTARLVMLDTFAKVRPTRDNRQNAYDEDYAAAGSLKALADEFGVAVLAVHHERKAQADDFIDAVSGTLGLTGAADTVLVIRRERINADGVLYVTGRDVEEAEVALRFDKHSGQWTLLGAAAEYRRSQQRQAIIDTLRANDLGLTAGEIADALGKTTAKVKAALRQTLKRMAAEGEITHAGNLYEAPPISPSHTSHQSYVSQESRESQRGLKEGAGVTRSHGSHRGHAAKPLNEWGVLAACDSVTDVTGSLEEGEL